VDHFNNLFKEPPQVKMEEVLKLISFFPRMIEEEDNRDLFHEISKEELLAIIYSFKRDKISSQDEWNDEFFKDFFDIIETDILRM
jgi:hypothetical protein